MDITKLSNSILGSRTRTSKYAHGPLSKNSYDLGITRHEYYCGNRILDRLQVTKR